MTYFNNILSLPFRLADSWPKTAAGMLSTAGTTASVAFIRHGKIYIGHCGDSGIVLGYADDAAPTDGSTEHHWRATSLTVDHKPESTVEKTRIQRSGGKVVVKSGVPRVVWNRPKPGNRGQVRRTTPIDEIPFLAVARSLGDFWSYNPALNKFVVSPDPDVRVIRINPARFRCLIFGTDGLWNVVSANAAVEIVRDAEQCNNRTAFAGHNMDWTNPSKCLVDKALEQWSTTRMRADNTSVVIIMIDPPGPPKREVLRNSPQQFMVENAAYVSGRTGENQTPQVLVNPNSNCTLFEHNVSKTLIDLAPPVTASGIATGGHRPVCRQTEAVHVASIEADADSEAVPQPPRDYSPIPFGFTFDVNGDAAQPASLPYEYAYAAAFNPMIHPMTCDPIEPLASRSAFATCFSDLVAPAEPTPAPEDTYSLTCLETRSSSTSSSTALMSSSRQHTSANASESYPTYDQPSTSAVATAVPGDGLTSDHDYLPTDTPLPPIVDFFSSDDLPAYDSSFLSQSCGIMQPALDDSVQTALMNNIPEPQPEREQRTTATETAEVRVEIYQPPTDAHVDMESEEECIDDYLENYCSPCPSYIVAHPANLPDMSADIAMGAVDEEHHDSAKLHSASIASTVSNVSIVSQLPILIDPTIQINEITSSSPKQKENHNRLTSVTAVSVCRPAQTNSSSSGYRIPMALRSAKRSAMRMTRSSKLPRTPSFDTRTKKPKTITKKSVAHQSPKPPPNASIVPSRVSVRTAQSSVATPSAASPAVQQQPRSTIIHDPLPPTIIGNRTLRSRNTISAVQTPFKRSPGLSMTPKCSPPSSSASATVRPAGRETRTASRRVKSPYQLMQTTRTRSLVRALSTSARKMVAAVASVAPSPSSTGGSSSRQQTSVQTRGASRTSTAASLSALAAATTSTATATRMSLSCVRSGDKLSGDAATAKKIAPKQPMAPPASASRSRFRKRLSR